jgi:hypothetical protein
MVISLALGGLVAPKISLVIGWICVIARACYTAGVILFNSEYRLLGVFSGNLPIILLAFYTLFKLIYDAT